MAAASQISEIASRHYEKHGGETPDSCPPPESEEEYEQRSEDFVERAWEDPDVEIKYDGDRVRLYDTITNEFAGVTDAGEIVTYFMPDDRGDCFTRQPGDNAEVLDPNSLDNNEDPCD